MKQIKLFALISAVALTSSLAFTSCKKENKEAEPQNNNAPTAANGSEVKTQFSISIPTTGNRSANAPRRMQGTIVQQAGNFNDITSVYLFPYAATAGPNPVGASDEKLGSVIILTSEPSTELKSTATENTRKYSDVAVPVGTASFLFYAKSAASGADNVKGKTTLPDFEKADLIPSEIEFIPAVRCLASSFAGEAKADAIVAYLTSIARTNDGTKQWGSTSDNAGMKDLFTRFTSLEAGSSADVQVVVSDLYSSVKDQADPMAVALVASITNSTYAAINPSGTKENGDLITLNTGLQGFPANQNLPDGAAALVWSGDPNTPAALPQCAYTNNSIAGLVSSSTTPISKFVYPAELLYGVNSTIHTNDHTVLQNYAGSGKTWSAWVATDDATNGYANTSRTVLASTRSVAIDSAINYGVARFDVMARLGSTVALTDREGTAISVPVGGYTLTGVLVGSQNKIDYMFHKVTGATDNYVIYDNDINGAPYSVTGSATWSGVPTNYTLVYETPYATSSDEIYFALELLNTGADFLGKSGVVPRGCKFYMVGKLNAADATNPKAAGFFFKQDFYTIARCTISDLSKAYNVIPDLRSSEMEIGMSVDLEWQAGHTFDIDDWE